MKSFNTEINLTANVYDLNSKLSTGYKPYREVGH